jgi:phytoene dehydrogenase-like protein
MLAWTRLVVKGTSAPASRLSPGLWVASLMIAARPKGRVSLSLLNRSKASWRTEKARYADRLLEELEAVFPSVRGHVTFAEGASPRTMERYTLNLTGAIYGWEVSPKQVGRRRLPHVTPIRGLYLSGHWTQPGGGVYAVVASGLETARAVPVTRRLPISSARYLPRKGESLPLFVQFSTFSDQG